MSIVGCDRSPVLIPPQHRTVYTTNDNKHYSYNNIIYAT